MTEIKIPVLPLFSSPVGIYELNILNQEKIEETIKSLEYKQVHKFNDHSLITTDLNVLDNVEEFKNLKDKIKESINHFSEKIVGNKPNKLELISSWATQSKLGQRSQRHRHANSLYSAVYYNTADKNTSPIRFYKTNYQTGFALDVDNYTSFNSDHWDIKPLSKNLVVFPSYLFHSIQQNNSKNTRYSIACNFHPTGTYGQVDSQVVGVSIKT